jgi:hypothetical protein
VVLEERLRHLIRVVPLKVPVESTVAQRLASTRMELPEVRVRDGLLQTDGKNKENRVKEDNNDQGVRVLGGPRSLAVKCASKQNDNK